tara:strand:- start:1165 stop:1983 length:819 start_codon:yes stop_codon:yes gene_type:complete
MVLKLIDTVDEIKKKVKEDGIYVSENFLDENENESLKNNILENSYSKTENHENTYISNLKGFIKNFYKINLIRKSIRFNKIAKKNNFKSITTQILDAKVELRTIDAYVSKISKNPVIDWHVDQAYSGKLDVKNFVHPDFASIKFFIYLTDVDTDNGCLGYIPSSNKVSYFLKKGIWNKEVNYSSYWKLADLRKKVMEKNTYSYLIKNFNKNSIDKFIEDASFVEHNGDSKKFDLKLKKGSLIIFDESGVHRGSSPSKNDRVVCRFHYRRVNN